LCSFLGLFSYYRRFIKDFAKCRYELTSKNKPWNWTAECGKAFNHLKSKLVSAPILSYLEVNERSFILDTGTSNDAIGAVLSQIQERQEKVITFGSRTLKNRKKLLCNAKRKLSLVYFIKHFKHYFLRREFILRTDQDRLYGYISLKNPMDR
jgi:hypothetical protein